jgi:hypothetical protein
MNPQASQAKLGLFPEKATSRLGYTIEQAKAGPMALMENGTAFLQNGTLVEGESDDEDEWEDHDSLLEMDEEEDSHLSPDGRLMKQLMQQFKGNSVL